jgi:hypothetical protein
MKRPEFYALPLHRQNYIADLIKRQFAPVKENLPGSRAEAVEQLGLVQSPAMQAQIAAGTVEAAEQQAQVDAMNPPEETAMRADGSVPMGGV